MSQTIEYWKLSIPGFYISFVINFSFPFLPSEIKTLYTLYIILGRGSYFLPKFFYRNTVNFGKNYRVPKEILMFYRHRRVPEIPYPEHNLIKLPASRTQKPNIPNTVKSYAPLRIYKQKTLSYFCLFSFHENMITMKCCN